MIYEDRLCPNSVIDVFDRRVLCKRESKCTDILSAGQMLAFSNTETQCMDMVGMYEVAAPFCDIKYFLTMLQLL